VTPLPTFVVKPFGVPARTFEYLMRPVTWAMAVPLC